MTKSRSSRNSRKSQSGKHSGKQSGKCKQGEIKRASYTRQAYTRVDGVKVRKSFVPASCIKDRGLPGKGKKLINITDTGFLRDHGFSVAKSAKERRSALIKAMNDVGEGGYSKVIKKLNAVAILNKNTNPEMYRKLRSDMKYLQQKYRAGSKHSKKSNK